MTIVVQVIVPGMYAGHISPKATCKMNKFDQDLVRLNHTVATWTSRDGIQEVKSSTFRLLVGKKSSQLRTPNDRNFGIRDLDSTIASVL